MGIIYLLVKVFSYIILLLCFLNILATLLGWPRLKTIYSRNQIFIARTGTIILLAKTPVKFYLIGALAQDLLQESLSSLCNLDEVTEVPGEPEKNKSWSSKDVFLTILKVTLVVVTVIGITYVIYAYYLTEGEVPVSSVTSETPAATQVAAETPAATQAAAVMEQVPTTVEPVKFSSYDEWMTYSTECRIGIKKYLEEGAISKEDYIELIDELNVKDEFLKKTFEIRPFKGK